jgi:hypothetical protein
MSAGDWFWLIASLILSFFMYWIPSIVALLRNKKNLPAIFAVNFFTGWTIIGWVVALVWALTYESKGEFNAA